MEREDKRGIFFGVIGVLTLIVAIIGASLAYFSINDKSEDNALTVQAATVKIVYSDGDQLLMAENVIPSTKEVALETYRRFLAGEEYDVEVDGETQSYPYQKCVDDKGYTVCGVYDFSLTNNGASAVDVIAKVIPTEQADGAIDFRNLKYTLYNITDVTTALKEDGTVDNGTEVKSGTVTYTTFNLFDNPEEVKADGQPEKYRLFVWLDEVGLDQKPQDYEQGATFQGTIYVNVDGANGDKLTGNANQTIGQ